MLTIIGNVNWNNQCCGKYWIQNTGGAINLLANTKYAPLPCILRLNGELERQENKLDLMKNNPEEAEIAFTPTIFVNARRLPETYNINELKNIF